MAFRVVAACAGLATAGIGIGLAFLPATGTYPEPSSSAAQLVAYYTANAGTATAQSVGSAILFSLITVFAAGLWASLRVADRSRGEAWAVVGLLGATATSATYVVAAALTLALARRAATLGGEDAVVYALWDTQGAVYALGGVFLALYVGGFSLAGQRAHQLPRWLSALGYLTAGLLLLGISGPFATGAVALIGYLGGTAGFLLWTLTAAVWLFRSASDPAHATAAAAAPAGGSRS